jgi:hypothetical protein
MKILRVWKPWALYAAVAVASSGLTHGMPRPQQQQQRTDLEQQKQRSSPPSTSSSSGGGGGGNGAGNLIIPALSTLAAASGLYAGISHIQKGQMRETIRRLRTAQQGHDLAVQMLQRTITNKDKTIETLRSTDEYAAIQTLQDEVHVRDVTIQLLKNDVRRLRAHAAQLEQQLGVLERMNREQFGALNGQIAKLKEELQATRELLRRAGGGAPPAPPEPEQPWRWVPPDELANHKAAMHCIYGRLGIEPGVGIGISFCFSFSQCPPFEPPTKHLPTHPHPKYTRTHGRVRNTLRIGKTKKRLKGKKKKLTRKFLFI